MIGIVHLKAARPQFCSQEHMVRMCVRVQFFAFATARTSSPYNDMPGIMIVL